MYESLSAHSAAFHLYIFPFDDLTLRILNKLQLKNVTLVPLELFETDELKKVKTERSKGEYCWTCTPSTISYVLNNYEVNECTYIDSDLFFYSDPAVLISELDKNGKNVLMTEHRFSFIPRLYEEKRGGRFCVQFLTFRNEQSSRAILDRWKKQCIDWCYARYEDGKFGDQKYLEEWPDIYQNTHILEHQGGGVAPWNLDSYRFYMEEGRLKGIVRKTGVEFDVVFYHFQYVKFMENNTYDIGWYHISNLVRSLFYIPYLRRVINTEKMLKEIDPAYQITRYVFRSDGLKDRIKALFKKTAGYNILDI
jgi:hypothetical protein